MNGLTRSSGAGMSLNNSENRVPSSTGVATFIFITLSRDVYVPDQYSICSAADRQSALLDNNTQTFIDRLLKGNLTVNVAYISFAVTFRAWSVVNVTVMRHSLDRYYSCKYTNYGTFSSSLDSTTFKLDKASIFSGIMSPSYFVNPITSYSDYTIAVYAQTNRTSNYCFPSDAAWPGFNWTQYKGKLNFYALTVSKVQSSFSISVCCAASKMAIPVQSITYVSNRSASYGGQLTTWSLGGVVCP
jgi:hypothetical protein